MEGRTVIWDKLREWNLREYTKGFQDEQINYETFLSLDTSDRLEHLIPKTGPRAKFRKRLREFKQSLSRQHNEEMMDTNKDTTTEDSNVMSIELSPQTLVSQEQGILATQMFVLRHQLSAAAQRDLMTVFKSILPNSNNDSCTFNKIKVDKRKCNGGSFFLFSSLKDLLKETLKCYGTKLLPKTVNCGDEINDIMLGEAYQNLIRHKRLSDDDITLLWNSDGAPLQQCSIWPLQFTINELPYQIRKQNVLVPGLWCSRTTEYPDMMTFLRPFIDECQDLAETPLEWIDNDGTVHRSRVFALVCSSDAVARPLLRNSKQFNGEYGCDWCLHFGTMVDKGARKVRTYVYDEQKQKARCEEMFHIDAREAEQSGKPVNGVKGFSILRELPNFNIVRGFVPEYSHTVLLGVTKQLVCLWLEEENSSESWYMGNRLDELDRRLLSLKSDLKTTRSPISLKCRDTWKAEDWQVFLLFYGMYVIEPYLGHKFFHHFHLLSCSIHMLLQDSVTQDILDYAHVYLVRFVQRMAQLYGEEHVTFNCHQLIHLRDSVQNWGPLWVTSALGFEKNNKDLQALLRDVVNKPEDIAKKFSIWQHIPNHTRSSVFGDSDFKHLLNSISSSPNSHDAGYAPLGNVCNLNDPSIDLAVEDLLKQKAVINAFDRFTNAHTVYHCANSNVTVKTKCTIKLKNGCYGEVQYFLEVKCQCTCTSKCSCPSSTIVVVRMFDTSPAFRELDMDQTAQMIFVKGKMTEQLKAFFIHDIKSECVNVNGLIVPIPNTQERY